MSNLFCGSETSAMQDPWILKIEEGDFKETEPPFLSPTLPLARLEAEGACAAVAPRAPRIRGELG